MAPVVGEGEVGPDARFDRICTGVGEGAAAFADEAFRATIAQEPDPE
jgi:hypothetical protein